jgi:hypothetical protein
VTAPLRSAAVPCTCGALVVPVTAAFSTTSPRACSPCAVRIGSSIARSSLPSVFRFICPPCRIGAVPVMVTRDEPATSRVSSRAKAPASVTLAFRLAAGNAAPGPCRSRTPSAVSLIVPSGCDDVPVSRTSALICPFAANDGLATAATSADRLRSVAVRSSVLPVAEAQPVHGHAVGEAEFCRRQHPHRLVLPGGLQPSEVERLVLRIGSAGR